MNNTMGWELDGEKASILWEIYEFQFPRFSPEDAFCCIFPCYGKLMGKLKHFSFYKVYPRIVIGCGKRTYTMGKVLVPISKVLPYVGFCCIFPKYGKFMQKRFPYDETRQFFSVYSSGLYCGIHTHEVPYSSIP